MVRNLIPFPRKPDTSDAGAEAFVDAVAREEAGEAPADAPRADETEAVWDALGQLDAKDFAVGDFAERPARPVWQYAAAACVVAGAGLFTLYAFQRPAVHESAIGEQKTVTLSDGSQVVLNTATRIEARVRGNRREVTLKHGEALFTVASDPVPFEVSTPHTRIRVTGTVFNVDLRPARTDIDLLQGRIEVGETNLLKLRAGQAVEVGADGRPGPVRTARTDHVDDWRHGRITLRATPLAEAVAEFNRYNRTKLVIGDAAVEDLRVDGVFAADDAEAFARALKALHGISTQREKDVIRLRPPA